MAKLQVSAHEIQGVLVRIESLDNKSVRFQHLIQPDRKHSFVLKQQLTLIHAQGVPQMVRGAAIMVVNDPRRLQSTGVAIRLVEVLERQSHCNNRSLVRLDCM